LEAFEGFGEDRLSLFREGCWIQKLIVLLSGKESISYRGYLIFLLLQCIRNLCLIHESQESIRTIRKDRTYPPKSTEDIISIINVLNKEDTLWGFIPLLTARNQLSHERLDNSGQESHALHQPVFGSMTDKRILVIEEVQHAEESYLVQLHKFFVDVEEVFVFVPS
jgi:hypothetical protein